MSAFADIVTPTSITAATVLVVLRYGPAALITVIAGVVATLTRHSHRGDRALKVLTLLHTQPGHPSAARRGRSSGERRQPEVAAMARAVAAEPPTTTDSQQRTTAPGQNA